VSLHRSQTSHTRGPTAKTWRTNANLSLQLGRYWGKRDPVLNLPTNSSLSVTLSQADLRALTTASCSATFPSGEGDTLILNGSPSPLTGARTVACIAALRTRRAALEADDAALPKLSTYPLRLVSENNFPTAAGLASSAAGFAALVRAVADLYALPDTAEDLSVMARQGSGSACRSLLGGFVAWRAGTAADGSDSRAEQVAPASHWRGVRALILVASERKKTVSSSSGMQQTVATSGLFRRRVDDVVPRHMVEVEAAIRHRDFSRFAEATMRDSNSFHATCADTYPPIFYMNDTSRIAVRAVEEVNARAGRTVAAYTFDAGPNCVVYYLEDDEAFVVGAFWDVLKGVPGWKDEIVSGLRVGDAETVLANDVVRAELAKGITRVIMTSVGEGPAKSEEHLIDEKGEPVKR
jgi:diphosphomevalonate decarboxylase